MQKQQDISSIVPGLPALRVMLSVFFFFFFPFFSSSSSHFAVMRYTLGNIDAAAEGEIPSESKCILAYQFSGKWVRVARSYGEMQDAGPS